MRLALFLCLLEPLFAALPPACPAGTPLGSFQISVAPTGTGVLRQIQTVNQLLPGYRISYLPAKLNTPDKKKARISLVLVPSDHGKVKVFDPEPADSSVEWTVPFRTEIAGIVYGPQGLNKGKVDRLLTKNDELAGQLADYAQKTEETQALIQAISQEQQALNTGQNVDAAVVSFASRYPGAKLDRTMPADQQLLTLVHSVNPALSAYDPLAQSPMQRASQSAGLAAAVAGLFFGSNVGLAASGGALLLNMHSLFFPNTEFRSALAQPVPDHKMQTALCGNKTASASRTELAFLWATRIPDSDAPEIALTKAEHLPIGAQSTVGVTVKARAESLAGRVQGWKLVSDDGKVSVPLAVRFSAEAKTLEFKTDNPKLKAGLWRLAGDWDWAPLTVAGKLELRSFSRFDKAHLTPDSHDRLTQSNGKCLVDLEGDDFEFVSKVAYKSLDDRFAQPSTIPFHVAGSATLETQLDPKSLGAGRYEFLIAQSDGKEHEVPFRVLPAPPEITNLPLIVNEGSESESFTLKGAGLDRIEGFSAEHARVVWGRGDNIVVRLDPAVKEGDRIALQMKVREFDRPVALPGALVVAGPRPEIAAVHRSQGQDAGVELRPGEIAAGSFVSFALDMVHAPVVSGVRLSCGGNGGIVVKLAPGSSYLSFNTSAVGQPGCAAMAEAMTPDSGTSLPKSLGTIVRVPHIEGFEVGDRKADENTYLGSLKGQDLDAIERIGWDAKTGTPVTAIPVANGTGETLQIAVPWPAPSPHAPLYIWLRGESAGRLTKILL